MFCFLSLTIYTFLNSILWCTLTSNQWERAKGLIFRFVSKKSLSYVCRGECTPFSKQSQILRVLACRNLKCSQRVLVQSKLLRHVYQIMWYRYFIMWLAENKKNKIIKAQYTNSWKKNMWSAILCVRTICQFRSTFTG